MSRLVRNFLLIASILLQFVIVQNRVFAQNAPVSLVRDVTEQYEYLLNAKEVDFHTSIKPYRLGDLEAAIDVDSALGARYGVKDNGTMLARYKNLVSIKKESMKLTINPIFSGQVGYGNDVLMAIQAGLAFNVDLGKKWAIGSNVFGSIDKFPSQIRNYAAANSVVPGRGFASLMENSDSAGYTSKFMDAYVSYTPSKHFHIQVGNGKNFIGDGYRSLLLSDYANSYPYVKINTKVWKINYVNLFMNLKDVRNSSSYSESTNKYVAMHYLSWNVTKRFNIGVFEGIIFQTRDSTKAMGFEFNYINPIIFLRPVEYAQGSSDNVLMGWSMKLKLFKKQQLYFQMILDEFLLREIRARSKWWANKYGFQLGFKSFDVFKIQGLKIQGEINMVRPYTYAHNEVNQNYGHYNQPLAHPLGANFVEGIGIIRYDKKRWNTAAKLVYANYGRNDSINYGKDIYTSYQNRFTEFGNTIGQGINEHLLVSELSLSYLVNPLSNFAIEFKFVNRSTRADDGNTSNNFIMFGLRTNILNRYYGI